jgi:hypothetical protein
MSSTNVEAIMAPLKEIAQILCGEIIENHTNFDHFF